MNKGDNFEGLRFLKNLRKLSLKYYDCKDGSLFNIIFENCHLLRRLYIEYSECAIEPMFEQLIKHDHMLNKLVI